MALKDGNLLINSDEISSTVSILTTIVSTLQDEMSSSINSDFNALIEANLFSSGITSISNQIKALSSSYQNLITEVSNHASEFEAIEDTFSSDISNYNSVYSDGNGGNSGSNISNDSISVNEVNDGTIINDDTLVNNIENITDDTLVNSLINFLNVNKDDNLTINSLLFDTSKSGMLAILLKKFYGDTENSSFLESETSTLIQKTLLKKLFATENLPVELSNNSILVAKEYLICVAKENNINVEDLLLDKDNTLILSTALLDLYDGNGISKYNLDNQTISDIRSYMDKVASSNNTTVESLSSYPQKFF